MKQICRHLLSWLAAIGLITGNVLALSDSAFALFLYMTLDDVIARTPIIIHVQVQSVDRLPVPGNQCPPLVKSTIIQNLKGHASTTQSEEFTFFGADDLKPGHTYLLLARSMHDGGIYFRQADAGWAQRMIKCGPFPFHQDMVWEVAEDSVMIGFSPIIWPNNISVTQAAGSDAKLASRPELFAYIEKSAARPVH